MVSKPYGDNDELAVKPIKNAHKYVACECGRRRKKSTANRCIVCLEEVKQACRIQTQNSILKFKAIGFNEAKIAQALHFKSRRTVVRYWKMIKERFGTDSDFMVAVLAKQAGLLERD